MNFIPDVRYDFQTPNIVTLAVKVVTPLPSPLSSQIPLDTVTREKGRMTAWTAL